MEYYIAYWDDEDGITLTGYYSSKGDYDYILFNDDVEILEYSHRGQQKLGDLEVNLDYNKRIQRILKDKIPKCVLDKMLLSDLP